MEENILVSDSTEKPIKQHYKSLTVWKKQTDGSWKT